MLKLGVRKVSEAVQVIDPSKVYGTVDQVMSEFAEDNNIKKVQLVPKVGINVAKMGAQMMFIIKEVHKTKAEKNLLCSGDIFLSAGMSDAIRTGELHISALKEFMIVEHENNTNGAIYPLIVRPTEVADEETNALLQTLVIDDKTAITKAYQRDNTDVKAVLQGINI